MGASRTRSILPSVRAKVARRSLHKVSHGNNGVIAFFDFSFDPANGGRDTRSWPGTFQELLLPAVVEVVGSAVSYWNAQRRKLAPEEPSTYVWTAMLRTDGCAITTHPEASLKLHELSSIKAMLVLFGKRASDLNTPDVDACSWSRWNLRSPSCICGFRRAADAESPDPQYGALAQVDFLDINSTSRLKRRLQPGLAAPQVPTALSQRRHA